MNAPIVVATDLTARSDRSLDRAMQLASQLEATLVLVHALETHDSSDKGLIERAHRAVDILIEDMPCPCDIVLEEGKAPELVARAAADRSAALVVVGAARYNHVSDYFLGTAVDYLVRRAAMPVLVVKERPRGAYDGVVVGTDFSVRSRNALVEAATLFSDLPIALVNAFGRPFPGRLGADVSLELGEVWSRDEMARFIDQPELVPLLDRITCHSVESSPAAALWRHAELHRSPLVVVGAHGWGVIAQALLGSRASDLLTAIPHDILIVRGTTAS